MGSKKADKTQLSPREAQIQQLRDEGFTYPQIAERLGITVSAVKTRVRSINARRLSLMDVEGKRPSC